MNDYFPEIELSAEEWIISKWFTKDDIKFAPYEGNRKYLGIKNLKRCYVAVDNL